MTHHRRYDAYELSVEFLTPDRAAGRIRWHAGDVTYTETR